METVIVVGAGPAGLAAALALEERGCRAVVLERESTAGGRAGVEVVDGFRFDKGAEILASFYAHALRLVDKIGMARTLRRVPLDGDVVRDGRRYRLPATPWRLLSTKLVGKRSKLRLARFGVRMLPWRSRLRWGALEEGAWLDDRSAEDFFSERIGRDYVEAVLRPTLESLTLSPAARTSCVVALSQMRDALGSRLLCPEGGLQAIWDEAARRLDVRFGVRVDRVAIEGDRIRVPLADGSVVVGRAAVIAVPAPEAARLVTEAAAPEAEHARAADYVPTVKLHVRFDEPLSGLRPMCPADRGVHDLAGLSPLESKGTNQSPPGKGGLNVCASPELSAQLIDEPDEAVSGRLLMLAEKLAGRPLPPVAGISVVRHRAGVPVFGVGWLRRLAAFRAGLHPAPIALAGDYLASPSIDGAVRSGEEAAARVSAWFATARTGA